jgi:aryl-alcohol dehydrogenase-like predicted oxidoreductase
LGKPNKPTGKSSIASRGRGGAGIPRALVTLAWLLAKPIITAPIVGGTKLKHLDDALASVDAKLSPGEITTLEEPYVPHAVVGFV